MSTVWNCHFEMTVFVLCFNIEICYDKIEEKNRNNIGDNNMTELSSLKNIGKVIERKLKIIDINSVEELKK